jgi:hypothetical protein
LENVSGEEPIIGSRWPAGRGSVRRQLAISAQNESGEATTLASDQSLTEKTRALQIDKGDRVAFASAIMSSVNY